MKTSDKAPSVREMFEARKAGGTVNKNIEGLGEVPIAKIDAASMIKLGSLPKEIQSRALVAKCVVDEKGKPLFAEAGEVGKQDYDLFSKLLAACYEVNGMKMKLEDAVGN